LRERELAKMRLKGREQLRIINPIPKPTPENWKGKKRMATCCDNQVLEASLENGMRSSTSNEISSA